MNKPGRNYDNIIGRRWWSGCQNSSHT